MVNRVKLVGNEAGDVFVPTYNWVSHFAPYMKKIPGIKTYHQFCFSSSSPGSIVCKEYSDRPGSEITVLKQVWQPEATNLPPVIKPTRSFC